MLSSALSFIQKWCRTRLRLLLTSGAFVAAVYHRTFKIKSRRSWEELQNCGSRAGCSKGG